MAAISSKEAQAHMIDPLVAPQPSEETGPGAHFGSTFAPRQTSSVASGSPRTSLSSNNPFRDGTSSTHSPPTKTGANSSARPIGGEQFPKYREDAFGGYDSRPKRATSNAARQPPPYEDATAGASNSSGVRRRGSSLRERYPGDSSVKPLDVIRRDSKKAHRSPHLNKRHIPGADMIDRLDPALGGRAYHHEGPYDAATLARNTDYTSSPIAALETSNEEALKATPRENIKDAVERHVPLDGVAAVPPGHRDRLGRTYEYEEGTDMMREPTADDPGYKRWPGKDYEVGDFDGRDDTSDIDRAMQRHKINDDGEIEMDDRHHLMKHGRKGTLESRDPVEVAGDDGYANGSDATVKRSGSLRHAGDSLKKRIGSLRHRKNED